MPSHRVRFVLFASCAVAAFHAYPSQIYAQGCSSCQTAQPAAGYYQPTTAYQTSGAAAPYYNGGGCNACNQTIAQPVQAQPLYQRPAYRPFPRSTYRTEWLPTRVTNYAPTTVANPVTGAPVTAYRGCQTQRYQIQRVPTIGLFSSGSSSCKSGCGVPGYQPSAAPGCSSCGVPSTYAPATIPYTTTPATISPSPAVTMPGAVTPGPASTTPGSTAPAETRPSLKPETRPSLIPEARTNAQGASIGGFRIQPSPRTRQAAPANPSYAPPSRSIRITPVPDPDAGQIDDQPAGNAPQLLDPRQKTAVRPTNLRTSYTRVAWPQTNSLPARVPATIPAVKTSRPAPVTNSGGWKTVDW